MVTRFSGINQQFSCYFLCSPSSSQPFGKKKTIYVDKHSQKDEHTKIRVYYNIKTPMRSQQTKTEQE